MSVVDEVCIVCADPLEWTAVGPCGHREACSTCVARLRYVLNDNRCVLCQQDTPAVYFTRFMGDYTQRLGPEEFQNLRVRCRDVRWRPSGASVGCRRAPSRPQ
jgi:hypothetical protein